MRVWLDETADFHIDRLPTTAGKRQITSHSLAHEPCIKHTKFHPSVNSENIAETLIQAVMVETP